MYADTSTSGDKARYGLTRKGLQQRANEVITSSCPLMSTGEVERERKRLMKIAKCRGLALCFRGYKANDFTENRGSASNSQIKLLWFAVSKMTGSLLYGAFSDQFGKREAVFRWLFLQHLLSENNSLLALFFSDHTSYFRQGSTCFGDLNPVSRRLLI